MTLRMKQILRFLLEKTESVSINILSEKIGVSKRTIQRELPYIQKELKPYQLVFMSKTGTGVWIEGEEKNKQALLNVIKGQKSVDVSDRDYRRKMICLELLKEKDLKKLYWYSSKFKVSEATISADIETLEPWFNKHKLTITRKPGSGVNTVGDESDFRKAIKAFIFENIGDLNIIEIYNAGSPNLDLYEKVENFDMKRMLDEKIFNRVILSLNGINDERINSLTDFSYTGLIIHISVALTRILHNETVEHKSQLIEDIIHTDDYELARKIAFELEEEFEIMLPEIEVAHICLHLNAAKYERVNDIKSKNSMIDGEDLYNLVNNMIYAFDKDIAYALKQDIEFLEGLITHLQPTLVRLNYDMNIHNPMQKTIENEYKDIFEKCKDVAKVIEDFINKPVPNSEVAFLTVHFCAAIVRIEEKKSHARTVNVAVICSSGIGVSRLMASKLKKIFKNRLNITTFGKRDVTYESVKYQDFLISSVPLTFNEIDIIRVNPLLSDKDIENIGKSISMYENKSEKLNNENVDFSFDKMYVCATLIKSVIDQIEFFELENDLSFDETLSVLASNITTDLSSQRVIIKDIQDREKISTQIFPEFRFALLHARTNGVENACVKISIPKQTKIFKDEYFNKIKVIFTMLIPKGENLQMNSEILGAISSSIVDSDELMSYIINKDETSVIKHISNTLKEYLLDISKK